MSKVTRLTGAPSRLHLREIPGDAEQPHETVGEVLRAARAGRGEELGEISRVLRIRKDYLEALESDCPDKLPGHAYAIGFLRAHANLLGLDAPALVAQYKEQTAGQGETAPQVGPPPEPERPGVRLGWTVAAVCTAGLLVYGLYQFSRPPMVAGPVAPGAPHMQGKAAANPVRQMPGVSGMTPVAAPNAAPLSTPPVPQEAVSGQVFGAQNFKPRVILHARALAHVLVQGAGGRVYINRLLHPGDVYRVPNLAGLSLTTADGGTVSLELDGQDMGAAGKPGRIAEAVSLDPRNIVQKKPPVSASGNRVTP